MPTFFSPRCKACCASAAAGALPFALGRESRTIVQPLRPAGHGTRVFSGAGGGSWAGAVVGVVRVVGPVVVGSGAVCVCARLEALGEVATTVWSLALERSVSHSADA